jgi:hypothetical protein
MAVGVWVTDKVADGVEVGSPLSKDSVVDGTIDSAAPLGEQADNKIIAPKTKYKIFEK